MLEVFELIYSHPFLSTIWILLLAAGLSGVGNRKIVNVKSEDDVK